MMNMMKVMNLMTTEIDHFIASHVKNIILRDTNG